MSTPELKSLNEALDEQGSMLDRIARDQERILMILAGNELDPKDNGLMGRVSTLEDDNRTMKEANAKLRWTFAGFMMAGTIVWGILTACFKFLFATK
jgi:hypothetical protein